MSTSSCIPKEPFIKYEDPRQGEALDCYNQKLQESATLNAELLNDKQLKQNEELQQKIDTINNIADPIQRAENYKKIFGDCCDYHNQVVLARQCGAI